MPKKVSTIKIKSRKLKAPEPVSDDETIQFDSEDVQQSGSDSEVSDATPEPVAKKSTRAKASKPAAKKPADSSSVASSRASRASTSTSSTANTKKTARAGRGSPEDAIKQIEEQEQRKLTRAQRQAAEAAYAEAIANHAAVIKKKTEDLQADYKLKQMNLADTRAERQRLMSRLVL